MKLTNVRSLVIEHVRQNYLDEMPTIRKTSGGDWVIPTGTDFYFLVSSDLPTEEVVDTPEA